MTFGIQHRFSPGEQVVREVAVMDSINPGGMYATRVRVLGRWARSDAACSSCSTEAWWYTQAASAGGGGVLQCCNIINAPGCCATVLCRACMQRNLPAQPL